MLITLEQTLALQLQPYILIEKTCRIILVRITKDDAFSHFKIQLQRKLC